MHLSDKARTESDEMTGLLQSLLATSVSSRNALEKKPASELTLDEAKQLLEDCVRLCFFRDCRAASRYNLAVVSKDGAVVHEPKELNTDNKHWEYGRNIRGFE